MAEQVELTVEEGEKETQTTAILVNWGSPSGNGADKAIVGGKGRCPQMGSRILASFKSSGLSIGGTVVGITTKQQFEDGKYAGSVWFLTCKMDRMPSEEIDIVLPSTAKMLKMDLDENYAALEEENDDV